MDVAPKLTISHKNIIAVQPMGLPDAMELIKKKLEPPIGEAAFQKLAEALGCMPLAITQATSYIRRQKLSISLSTTQYLEEYEKSDHTRSKLLGYEAGHSQRDINATNSILNTWHISFDHIRRVKPSAAGLLSLMSFFDPQAIPEWLLCESHYNVVKSTSHDENSPSSSDGSEREEDYQETLNFRDNITILREYSFISLRGDNQDPDDHTFVMHPLVQLAARQWLETHGEVEKQKAGFIKLLHRSFPRGGSPNWIHSQSLFVHVESAFLQSKSQKRPSKIGPY